jgi:hypothetical protein
VGAVVGGAAHVSGGKDLGAAPTDHRAGGLRNARPNAGPRLWSFPYRTLGGFFLLVTDIGNELTEEREAGSAPPELPASTFRRQSDRATRGAGRGEAIMRFAAAGTLQIGDCEAGPAQRPASDRPRPRRRVPAPKHASACQLRDARGLVRKGRRAGLRAVAS